VTRGQLPQRAGSLGLNGGGTAAVVPPIYRSDHLRLQLSCFQLVTTSFSLSTNTKPSVIDSRSLHGRPKSSVIA